MPKNKCNSSFFLGLTIGNGKDTQGNLHSLYHTWCITNALQSPEGVAVKDSSPLAGHALTRFCVPFRGCFIEGLWQKPFSGASAETSYPGEGGKTLKTLSSPSRSTLCSSPPGPRNCKSLLFGALLALRRSPTSELIHLTLIHG